MMKDDTYVTNKFFGQIKVLDDLVNGRTFSMRVWLYTVVYDVCVLLVGRMNMGEN